MNITIGVTVWRWRITEVTISTNIDEVAWNTGSPVLPPAPPKIMDAVSDFFANRWFNRHPGTRS